MGSTCKQLPARIRVASAILIWLSLSFTIARINGKVCPGICSSNSTVCEIRGGHVIGYCKNGKSCCEIPGQDSNNNQKTPDGKHMGSCGQAFKSIASNTVISFKSPNYPASYSGDLICEFKVHLNSDTTAIRIDFVTLEMDGLKYGLEPGNCDSDRFLTKGFIGWAPPPLCGNLSGYSTLIDKADPRASDMTTLVLVAVMSTLNYRWYVEVTLLSLPSKKKRTSKEQEMRRGTMGENYVVEMMHVHSEDAAAPAIPAEKYQNPNPQPESRPITNGKDTLITQIPWQVSLRTKYSAWEDKYGKKFMDEYSTLNNCNYSTESFHFCGGSIIHPKYILTAAHCVSGSSKVVQAKLPSDIIVVVGDTDKCVGDDDDEVSSTYEVEKIIFHFAYDPTVPDNDVLLLELKEEIRFEDTNAQIINLAKSDANFTGRTAMASGWGLTNLSSQNTPNILQSNNNFVILNQASCTWHLIGLFGDTVDKFKKHRKYSQSVDSVICTSGTATKNVLNDTEVNGNDTKTELASSSSTDRNEFRPALTGEGDSGGPLVVFGDDDDHETEDEDKGLTPVLVGIVSYSLTQEHKLGLARTTTRLTIDYFQSVSFFRNWITTTTLSFEID